MATAAILAVPAKPGLKKKVTLSNGSIVELTLRGDEHYAFYTDASGEPCQLKQGRLLKMTHEEVNRQWAAQREKRLAYSETAGRRANRRVGDKQGATTGTHRGLVILMQFPDMPFTTENAQHTFQRFFNEEGYNEMGMAGSVRDYFKKQSYGQLTIDFDVAGPFTTQHEMEYYGGHYTDSYGTEQNDKHPALMVAEAVDSAHVAGIDFSKYDWDGDGVVDQVFVIYAGYAEAQGADPSTIWPHEWSLAAERAMRYYDNVTINTYGCAAELWGANSEANPDGIDGIGTACHEFSHCLGLPDTYDTQGDNYGMGYWDIMCAGNYNDYSRTPAGYTSYERWFSGWLEPKELSTMTRITDMKPLIEEPEAYVLYNDKNKNEYYLLENRQPISYDKGLYGHGLLVLHVDYDRGAWNANSVNTIAGHERMTIIAADNEYGSYYTTSIAGDPFPGRTNNTALTNYTTPAATLYNANADGQKLMSKPIDNITENVLKRTISFVACRPELATPEAGEATELPDGTSFTVTWPAVSGAIGYELELNATDHAASTPAEAMQHEFDFSGCVTATASFQDISGKLSQYGLPGWSGSKLYTSPEKLRFGTSTTTGKLKSPTWKVPTSTDITVVMGANVAKSGTTVNGKISITYGNQGDLISDCPTQSKDFEITGNERLVFNFNDIRKDLYWLEIEPASQMYLNYLAIYDGTWTAEQLGTGTIPAQVARRAVTTSSYTLETNSYTFKDMDVSKRYAYRIRALGEDNTYSQWSEENTFEFGTTNAIQGISPADETVPVRYYDLQGREVSSTTKGVLIRKQGHSTKKVLH